MLCARSMHHVVLLYGDVLTRLSYAVQRGGGRYQNGEANYGRPTIPLTELIADVMSDQEVCPFL